MRFLTLVTIIAFCQLCNGQQNWQDLFRIDPEEANGYFILNRTKTDALGIERVQVDIIGTELGDGGISNSTTLETLTIEGDAFFARADFELWEGLNDPYRVHYRARGFNGAGVPVVDVQSVPPGQQPWPELCRETCESNLYAYTLIAFSDGAQAVIEIHNGTVNGQAARLYVKQSNWQAFQDMFDPWEHFGIGGGTWSDILMPPYFQQQTDVMLIDHTSQSPPPDARDYMGNLLGNVAENVYAVKKGKGPWRDLHACTSEMGVQGVCGNGAGHIRTLYNANGLVQNALTTLDLDPLSCQGMLASGVGLSWGSGYASWCTNYHWELLPEGVGFFENAVISIIGCVTFTYDWVPSGPSSPGTSTGSGPNGEYILSDVANVIVSHWGEESRTEVLSIPVKGINDPKLIKVRKTVVPAGLYEFMLIMNDGRILSRIIELKQATTLNADFAAFTNVSIYPVPVRDQLFAVDLDLPAPTTVTLTVLNNMGVPYFSESLVFDLAGKNKHVVKMDTPWPQGLYHAVLQYADGSVESVSLTVE
jgi:hypothetical protein